MRRLSSYPKKTVKISYIVRDAHGAILSQTSNDEDVVWINEVRNMTINNSNFLVQSWFLTENEPLSNELVVEYKGRTFNLAGFVEYDEQGLKHWQVFLT